MEEIFNYINLFTSVIENSQKIIELIKNKISENEAIINEREKIFEKESSEIKISKRFLTKNNYLSKIFELFTNIDKLNKRFSSHSCNTKECFCCLVSHNLNKGDEIPVDIKIEEHFRIIKPEFYEFFEYFFYKLHNHKQVKCIQDCLLRECFAKLYQEDFCECGYYMRIPTEERGVSLKVKDLVLPKSSSVNSLIPFSGGIIEEVLKYTNCKLLYENLEKYIVKQGLIKESTNTVHVCATKQSRIITKQKDYKIFSVKFDWNNCEKSLYHALQCISLLKPNIELSDSIFRIPKKTLNLDTIVFEDIGKNIYICTFKNSKWWLVNNGTLKSFINTGAGNIIEFIYLNMLYPLFCFYTTTKSSVSSLNLSLISLYETLSYNLDIGIRSEYSSDDFTIIIKLILLIDRSKCFICSKNKKTNEKCSFCGYLDGDWICNQCDNFCDSEIYKCNFCKSSRLNEEILRFTCPNGHENSLISQYCILCDPKGCEICKKLMEVFGDIFCIDCNKKVGYTYSHYRHKVLCFDCSILIY